MDFEFATDWYMQRLLPPIRGHAVFVEIGLGSLNWSFTWASTLGYRCVAVEPVPVEALRQACERYGVTLVESAVGRTCGVAKIYHGELNGFELPDTSSLDPNWWGIGKSYTEVNLLNLATLLTKVSASAFVSLKVDVEGSESAVMSGLMDIDSDQLPAIVSFEYGGGGNRSSRTGGWNTEGIDNTLNCLKVLKQSGYTEVMICDQTMTVPSLHSIADDSPLELDRFFPEIAEVGMIIASLGPFPPELISWSGEFRIADARRSRLAKVNKLISLLNYKFLRFRNGVLRILFKK